MSVCPRAQTAKPRPSPRHKRNTSFIFLMDNLFAGIFGCSFLSKQGHRIPVVIHVRRAGYLLPWGWQLCRVMGGSFRVKWVAALL